MNLSKNNELSYVMYMNILNEKDKEINFFMDMLTNTQGLFQ